MRRCMRMIKPSNPSNNRIFLIHSALVLSRVLGTIASAFDYITCAQAYGQEPAAEPQFLAQILRIWLYSLRSMVYLD